MSKEIRDIDDLYRFLLENNLTPEETRQLIQTTLKIWVSGEYQGKELVKMLQEYLEKWKGKEQHERPLFLDVDDDKVQLSDFGYKYSHY